MVGNKTAAPGGRAAAHVLVMRLSALGDVAMTVPIVDSVARRYPDVRFTVLSRAAWRPLFAGMPANVRFEGVDLKRDYRGVWGLWRLFRRLRQESFTAVADCHDVLRTRFLRLCFRAAGVRTAHIDKGRSARRSLTSARHKCLTPLPSAFERYAQVFSCLGYTADGSFHSIFAHRPGLVTLPSGLPPKGREQWVGVAPFAAHAGKVYPPQLMQEVLTLLSRRAGVRLFLFGGGERERQTLTSWAQKLPNAVCVAGMFHSMSDELALMSHLDVMLSMDSANMHLASLVDVPVVSVWGATHPAAGFMGWRQPLQRAVQLDLPCRPCSIYGNRPCRRADYACLKNLRPAQVADRVCQVLDEGGR